MEQLREQAEAEMRRPAPDRPEGSSAKRQKTQGGGTGSPQEEDDTKSAVARFSYAADDALVTGSGSTCFMATCGFNRQRSAAKEMLEVLKPLLPGGTRLEHVKLACRGLAVLRAAPAGEAAAVPVQQIVAELLAKMEAGDIKHTRFCERIVPAETTCALSAPALQAALWRVLPRHITGLRQQGGSSEADGGTDGTADGQAGGAGTEGQQQQPQPPVQFAVLYKSRGVDRQALAEQEGQQEGQEGQEGAAAATAAAEGAGAAAGVAGGPDAATTAAAAAGPGGSTGLDRDGVIKLAAAVMEECCRDCGGAKVCLSSPQVVVMVEVVPLIRQQLVCAVAVLPGSMLSTSHKLKVRPTSAAAADEASGGGGGRKAAGQAGKRQQQGRATQQHAAGS